MTEQEARDWIASRHGPAAEARVGAFLELLIAENQHQNLVAPSTIPMIWARHVVDSAQLARLGRPGLWVDIGTGGGFPGMIVALLRPEPLLMVEPRARRAAFLAQCVAILGLIHARVVSAKVETVRDTAATISARAVAPVEKLLRMAAGCAKEGTRWLLPRGRLTAADLAFLQRNWRGAFHVEQSLTDPASSILVLEGVSTQ